MKSVPRRLLTTIKQYVKRFPERLICSFSSGATIVRLLGFFRCCFSFTPQERQFSLNTWLRLHIVRFHRFPHENDVFIPPREGISSSWRESFRYLGRTSLRSNHIFDSICVMDRSDGQRLSVRRCFFRCLFIDMSIVHGSCQSLLAAYSSLSTSSHPPTPTHAYYSHRYPLPNGISHFLLLLVFTAPVT